MMDAREILRNLSPRGWTLLAACTFGLLGATVSIVVLELFFDVNLLDGSSSGWTTAWPYVVSASITGAIVGGLVWLGLIEKPTNASDRRGLAAGAIAMLATLVLMLAVPVAWGMATDWSRPELSSLPGGDPIGLYFQVVLFLFGPITLPVAGFLGRALARRRRGQIGEGPPVDVRKHLDRLSPRGWTLLAACTFGLGAMVTSVAASVMVVVLLPLGAAIVLGIFLAPFAGLGGFVVGGISWWLGVELRHSASTNTGVYVGGTTGLLAHYLMWPASNVGWYAEIWEPYTLYEFLRYVAVDVGYLGTLSALLTGIVTVPVGGYIGWRLVRLRRSSIGNSTEESGK